jgi:hypothetical protein
MVISRPILVAVLIGGLLGQMLVDMQNRVTGEIQQRSLQDARASKEWSSTAVSRPSNRRI